MLTQAASPSSINWFAICSALAQFGQVQKIRSISVGICERYRRVYVGAKKANRNYKAGLSL